GAVGGQAVPHRPQRPARPDVRPGPGVRPRRPDQRILHRGPPRERLPLEARRVRGRPSLRLQALAHRARAGPVRLRRREHGDVSDAQGARPRVPPGCRGAGGADVLRHRGARRAHPRRGRDRRRPARGPLHLRGLRRRCGRGAQLRLRAPAAAGHAAPARLPRLRHPRGSHGPVPSVHMPRICVACARWAQPRAKLPSASSSVAPRTASSASPTREGSQMTTTVLGIDSSTQATKALLVDAETGEVLEERRAAHPDGTEVDPRAWLAAADEAAGPLLERAEAVAVGGQQHGMVLLDARGEVVRDALLCNDTRSAPQAEALIEEMGGAEASVGEIGSLMVASFTASKLRWVRDEEPQNADRAASVLLPHDYVSRHLAGGGEAFTDRGDASGTSYCSTASEQWKPGLVELALGHGLELPRLPGSPQEIMARTPGGAAIAPGTGDNMGAALGLSLGEGDVSVSIGSSGVCAMVSATKQNDATGTGTDFYD